MIAKGSTEVPLEQGPVPLYYQLEQRLRERITGAEFEPGGALPTEDRICHEYQVSRITVRRALESLQRQGLIERRSGVGSFVADKPGGINSRLTGSLSEFIAVAGTLRIDCIGLEECAPPADVRKTLGLADGEAAVLLRTTGSLEEGPVGYFEIWFPLEIGRKLTAADVAGNTPVIRLVEKVAKLRITRAEQTIEPDHAGKVAAQFLQIDPQTPILRVQRVYFVGDRPIELAQVRYHPDRYRYAIEFKS
jgi:GntR family transcriptional regulator